MKTEKTFKRQDVEGNCPLCEGELKTNDSNTSRWICSQCETMFHDVGDINTDLVITVDVSY